MKKIITNQENSKQRIDKFLVKELFSYTRGEIIRNIKAGNITVNGKKIKPSYILRKNDELGITISERKIKIIRNEKIRFDIIYQNKNVIVINKPAGLKVHPSKSSEKLTSLLENNTLVNGLLAKFPEIKNVGDEPAFRPGIVHRLDKDTSGIMIVARNQKSFKALKKLFQERKVKKEYLAIIFGKMKSKKGKIEKPIARARGYKKQTIAGAKTRTKIRPAITEYEVLKEYKDYSLVKALPKTGRMHQIRVHLASLGHPIVGDAKYKFKNLTAPEKVYRQLLHSKSLRFKLFGRNYFFEAELAEDFSNLLKGLTQNR